MVEEPDIKIATKIIFKAFIVVNKAIIFKIWKELDIYDMILVVYEQHPFWETQKQKSVVKISKNLAGQEIAACFKIHLYRKNATFLVSIPNIPTKLTQFNSFFIICKNRYPHFARPGIIWPSLPNIVRKDANINVGVIIALYHRRMYNKIRKEEEEENSKVKFYDRRLRAFCYLFFRFCWVTYCSWIIKSLRDLLVTLIRWLSEVWKVALSWT